ncbi:MAG: class I SAM-dependent methyltransferase, partial [Pseudomonadota bacterium]
MPRNPIARTLVERQFGRSASDYAISSVHAEGESLAELDNRLAPQRGWRAVVGATGAAHMALALAPHVASVVATDITAEMLQQTDTLVGERGLDNVTTQRASADSLPFASATLDAVTCRLAAHHFPEISDFLAEAHRALRLGGRLGIVDNIAPSAALTDITGDADETRNVETSDDKDLYAAALA